MKMRFTMKRIQMGLALGGALVLLACWILHQATRIPEVLKPSAKSGLPPKEAPRAQGESTDAFAQSRQGTASPPARAVQPAGTPTDSPNPVPKVGPRGGRWDHLRYLQGISAGQGEAGCQEAIRRTAAHLSIDARLVSEFEAAARQSILEMQQALEVRKRELSTSAPTAGSSILSEQEQSSAARYAAARMKALDRLERFLSQSPVHQEFRWALDSWASMVATRARSEDP